MESLYLHALALYGFAQAHWGAISVGLVVAAAIWNKLAAGHPTWSSKPRKVFDWLIAASPMPDCRSMLISALAARIGFAPAAALVGWVATWLQLPIVDKSIPAAPAKSVALAAAQIGDDAPRAPRAGGFAVVALLAILAVGGAVLGMVHEQAHLEQYAGLALLGVGLACLFLRMAGKAGPALLILALVSAAAPARAQEVPIQAGPELEKRGGWCWQSKDGVNWCVAPVVSMSALTFDFSAGKIDYLSSVGLGYGILRAADKPWAHGFFAAVNADTKAQALTISGAFMLFNYIHLGASWRTTDHKPVGLLSFGTDFGSPTAAAPVAK